jgi:hypothetical protein
MVSADVVRETATRFQHAIEALDTPGAVALMSEDVQLYSPVPRAPFEGRDVVAAVFDFLATVASAPHFVSVAHGENEAILCFDGSLAGRDCEWIHRVQIDEDGNIWRITDMVRPLSAVLALQTAASGRTT